MSYDFIIYAATERLPSPEAFASALAAGSPPLRLEPSIPDPQRDGFRPVVGPEGESGFEVFYGEITADDIAEYEEELAELRARGESIEASSLEYLQILNSCNVRITLSTRTKPEMVTAARVAHALAGMAGGWLCDPQRGVTIKLPAGSEEPEARDGDED